MRQRPVDQEGYGESSENCWKVTFERHATKQDVTGNGVEIGREEAHLLENADGHGIATVVNVNVSADLCCVR